MTFRQATLIGVLAVLGLAAAAALGLAANAVSGDSIGLSAEPLSAGTELAPRRAQDSRKAGDGHRGRNGAKADTTSTTTPTTTTPATTTAIEPGDDGGGSINSGPGSSSSGSGSSGSGSGSSGSSGGSDD
jgi:hypothetical protein